MSFLQILNFFGGLALFLFGMNRMSNNLQALAGGEIHRVLKKMTSTPLRGAFVGMGFTALVQSSATTVMTIGLVNAGIMTLNQAIGVVMGANIGTTITVQLIAFRIGDIALAFVIAGVVLMFIRRSRAMERWSLILLGFGLLFVGLNQMTEAVLPLRDSATAYNIISTLSSNPFLAVLTGMIFTMIIQSSTASAGILIVLANAGLIGFEGALYLIYGNNIGTTVTAWLAGVGANSTARRVALVHTLFNVFGTIIFGLLTYLGVYTAFINLITPGDVYIGENIARHLANGHTFFNVINTLLFLPFAASLAKLAEKIIPKGKEELLVIGEPKHLNYHLVNDAEIAIEQAIKEMREMMRLVKEGLTITFEAFHDRSYRKQGKVAQIENAVDNLQREITRYLVVVNERTKRDSIIQKIPALIHTINDIEKLGDYTEEANRILNDQMETQKAPLSEEILNMISDMETKILEMLDLNIAYLKDFQRDYPFKIIEMEGRINEQHRRVRDDLITKIQNGSCDAESGLNTIDFIDVMERFGDKIKNIVKAGSYNFLYYEDGRETRKAGQRGGAVAP